MSGSPLSGILVVDLSRHLPGPLAARLLRDLGARVIKVEEPKAGDPVRRAPPMRGSRSALAALLLGGLESIALDLREPSAKRVLERLIERADVLLESFRPGTLAKLGFAPKELLRRNPRLVLCSISGWGQKGPLARRAGHDLTYQALAGTLAATGSMPAAQVADVLGAWAATASILASLVEREQTGSGQHLDAALFDAAAHGNLTALAAEVERPHEVGERLSLTGALPCYNLYRTGDGQQIALAALEPKFWRRFCELIERPDLESRQFEPTQDARSEVASVVARRTRREWEELVASHDLPLEPVLSVAEYQQHPQARRNRLVTRHRDGTLRLGFPVTFAGKRPRAGQGEPELGEHTDHILEELGMQKGSTGQRS